MSKQFYGGIGAISLVFIAVIEHWAWPLRMRRCVSR